MKRCFLLFVLITCVLALSAPSHAVVTGSVTLAKISEDMERALILMNLEQIDKQAIRAIREYITGDDEAKAAAMAYLNIHETNAKAERAKLK